jgi:hypothetical protein
MGEDPEVDASMRPAVRALLLTSLLLVGSFATLPLALPSARANAPGAAVTGNMTGPDVLAYHGVGTYVVNGTGGPAVLPNGTIVGNLTYYLSVTGANTTGVSFAPASGLILTNIPGTVKLTVANLSEVLTITVMLSSVLNATNVTTNFTITVTVVQPYILSTTLYNLGNESVTSFPVIVDLDGTTVGNVSVPTMLPHASYALNFQYATLGLSSGTHTFSIHLTTVHGLVRFANDTTVYSVNFYIPGPPPSYTLWYVAGAVAFLGALFIFGARVGARRRSASKK